MQLEDDFLEFLHDTEVVMQVHVAIGSDCQTIAATPVKFCEILSYPTNKVSLYRQNNLKSKCFQTAAWVGCSLRSSWKLEGGQLPRQPRLLDQAAHPRHQAGSQVDGEEEGTRDVGQVGGKRGNKNCGVQITQILN